MINNYYQLKCSIENCMIHIVFRSGSIIFILHQKCIHCSSTIRSVLSYVCIFVLEIFSLNKYSKTCLKRSRKKNTKMVFNTDYRLMQVKYIAECSPWSILQYIRPSLSYRFPFKTFVLSILSGRLRQVLLYIIIICPWTGIKL